MTAVAVAQVSEQQQVSKQESLSLMSQLLEVSVYHLTYLRQLFPEGSYRTVHMKQLDNMDIRLLKSDFEDGKRVKAWMADVREALSLGYLYKLHFCVAKDGNATDLIEQYSYTFSYDASGMPSIDLDHNNKKVGKVNKSKAQPTPETIRFEVVRMMRMLVTLTNTLDEVEAPFYVTMKLEYQDHTPEDFQLPAFQPMEVQTMTHMFERAPFSMEVGKVDTGHHKVALTLRSILDVDEPPESHASPDQVELIPDTACHKEAGHNSDTQYGSQSLDDEAEVSRKRYKAGVEAAAVTKQRSVSPLQVADTPMTESPQLQQAPKLNAAASPTETGNVDVPDMSKLKIGNQPVRTNLASKPEGYEADVAEDTGPEDPSHERKPLRPDAATAVAKALLTALAHTHVFTKNDAVQALKNTSARRVDRALAALVKDGHIRKMKKSGHYEFVGRGDPKDAATPPADKKPLQAGRVRRREAQHNAGATDVQRKRPADGPRETEHHEMAEDDGDDGPVLGPGGSQGPVLLCSQEKRRGAVATKCLHQRHKRHRGNFKTEAHAAMAR